MYLRFRQSGVDKLAAVMHVDDIQQLILAQGDIYLHLCYGGAEGIGIGADGIGGFAGHIFIVLHGIEHLRSQLAQRHEHLAVRGAHNAAVYYIQAVYRHTGQGTGVVQNFLFQFQPRLLDGKAPHIGLSGSIGSGAEGSHVRILIGEDVDLFKGNAYGICCHLGKGRVRSLTDLRFAQLQLYGTVLIEHHPAGGGFE